MWGGRFNPVIVLGDENADALVRLFRLDALYPASAGEDVNEFVSRYGHLPWPLLGAELFAGDEEDRYARIIDIFHPMQRLHKEHLKTILHLR